jgi:heterodisulfide reductase subunit A2
MNLNDIKIGVYICHCGMNIFPKVDVEAVSRFVLGLNHVIISRDYKFMCSNPGQEYIIGDIQTYGLNRIVVASCSPRMHEPTFRKACENAGINPHFFQMANIREQVSWVTKDAHDATKKAMDLVKAAVARVTHHHPLTSREVAVTKSVLVVGGGIAGIQAAISAANAGYQVHLVEREPSIGGHMAKFDKTFPTLDCAACIMTPKTVEVSQYPNINLLTYSELMSLEGFVGNFKAKIRKKPRYVIEGTCTGCGICTEVCPVSLVNSFDEGMSMKKAVYRSFPQAVPITFCIEKKDPAPCRQACPAGINIQGYIQLIKKGRYEQAVRLIMEKLPLPGVLGRVCPHPCENVCRRGMVDQAIAICDLKRFAADQVDVARFSKPDILDRKEKVAVIGSGPAGLTVAYDLRKMGYTVSLFEALSKLGGMLRVGIPDYRLPPEVLDKEIQNILDLGIDVRIQMKFGSDFDLADLEAEGFSAIFLGIGAHEGIKLNIPGEEGTEGVVDAVKYLREVNLGTSTVFGKKVVVVGGGNVAMDAARTAKRRGARSVTVIYRRTESEMPAYPDEIKEAKEENIQISFLAVPVKILKKEDKLTGLECTRTRLGAPDASGRRRPEPVANSNFAIGCDVLIPAIGQAVETGWYGNGSYPELTVRKTVKTDPVRLNTTIPHVFAGGDAVRGPATVIEAVADGHRAALGIHAYIQGIDVQKDARLEHHNGDKEGKWLDIPVNPVIRKREVKGHASPGERARGFSEVSAGFSENQALLEAERCLNCGACSECMACVEACEVKAIDHLMEEEMVELEIGAVILSTGFKAFDPSPLDQYGYGIYPEVYTSLEFERLNNATGPTSGQIAMKNGDTPKRVAIIHCVGSRDKNHQPYCSRVCCMYSMKFAHLVREKTGAEVWEFYIDIRSPGKLYEEFYNRVQEEGVQLIRGRVADVTDIVDDPDNPQQKGRLTVTAENTLTRRTLRIPVDMVILSVGLQPAEGATDVGRMAGVSVDGDGWFTELHAKLAPVATPSRGIFLAGCCQGPKDIPDTVSQAMAASGEAVALLSAGTVKTRAEISFIEPDLCTGCGMCLQSCVYHAIDFDEGRQIAVVNEALCQGCGSCSAVCPSSAASVKHFTDRQVMEELEAILDGTREK